MSRNLHQEITARIVSQLKAGVVPWRQPWSGQAMGAMPRNAITGRAYSGANVLLLWATAIEKSYAAPLWLTYKQAQEAGGQVRKGEKSTQVIFVSQIEKQDDDGQVRRIPFLKSFNVFNIAQVDGLSIAGVAQKPRHADRRDDDADAFLASTGATITHGEARAYFSSKLDRINLPAFETFTAAGAYYATAFHELGHWTGAETRLNRTFGRKFGDAAYSAEELVAELTSAFICAEFGFDNVLADAASYIAHWIKFFESHDQAIVTAAAAASKAVEFLRGLALAEPALASRAA